jgi:hypothetical protein
MNAAMASGSHGVTTKVTTVEQVQTRMRLLSHWKEWRAREESNLRPSGS